MKPVAAAAAALLLSCLALPGILPAQARAPDEWLTRAERTGFKETENYEDTRAYARRLDAASPWIKLVSFGTSPQGRDLMLLVASKDGAFDPAAARATGKPVVLVQNGIHSGEIEGKDASLMLLRDIAVTREKAALLDGAILLVMPLFNVDGYGGRFGPHTRINQNGPAESGWRTTAQNLNLNRDYMKADAPEMRAWLAVYDAWQPALLIDDHTTDGADFQYVIGYDMAMRDDAPAPIGAWARDVFLPYVTEHVERAGYPTSPYLDLRVPTDPAQGFLSDQNTARYSTGYTPLRNRPSLLVETHMLKPYEPRVRATYETLVAALEVVGREAARLQEAIRDAEREASGIGRTAEGDSVTLRLRLADSLGTFHYKGVEWRNELSEVSGAVRVVYGTKPVELDVPYQETLVPTLKVRPPLGYLIPPEWSGIADRLRAHGIPVERLETPVRGTFEVIRISSVKWSEAPFEGRHLLVAGDARRALEPDSLPAGAFWVPLGNAYSRLTMQLLEPEGPDSFVAWGFFDAIFEDKEYAEDYVMETLARELLAKDPQLKEEFEAKVASDSAFRANPAARLEFFYRRTPWWDDRKDRYPVLRVVTPLARP